jgi:carbon storage regulator
MLVLSRKCNEDIVIGGKVVVRVLSVRGDKVLLGIEADAATVVDRGEVHARRLGKSQRQDGGSP